MKKIRNGIIILIIIVIIAFIYLYINKKQNNGIVQNTINIEEQQEQIEEVTERDKYYIVNNIINKYFSYNYLEKADALYNILNNEYIKENDLTEEKIKSNLIKTELVFLPKKMHYEKLDECYERYYVYGYTYEYNSNEYDLRYNGEITREYNEFYAIVDLDTYNMTFSITPNKYME